MSTKLPFCLVLSPAHARVLTIPPDSADFELCSVLDLSASIALLVSAAS